MSLEVTAAAESCNNMLVKRAIELRAHSERLIGAVLADLQDLTSLRVTGVEVETTEAIGSNPPAISTVRVNVEL